MKLKFLLLVGIVFAANGSGGWGYQPPSSRSQIGVTEAQSAADQRVRQQQQALEAQQAKQDAEQEDKAAATQKDVDALAYRGIKSRLEVIVSHLAANLRNGDSFNYGEQRKAFLSEASTLSSALPSADRANVFSDIFTTSNLDVSSSLFLDFIGDKDSKAQGIVKDLIASHKLSYEQISKTALSRFNSEISTLDPKARDFATKFNALKSRYSDIANKLQGLRESIDRDYEIEQGLSKQRLPVKNPVVTFVNRVNELFSNLDEARNGITNEIQSKINAFEAKYESFNGFRKWIDRILPEKYSNFKQSGRLKGSLVQGNEDPYRDTNAEHINRINQEHFDFR